MVIEELKNGSVSESRKSELRQAIALWEELEDVPVDEESLLVVEWRGFEVGTQPEEIWQWFESSYGVSVAEDLMYGAYNELLDLLNE